MTLKRLAKRMALRQARRKGKKSKAPTAASATVGDTPTPAALTNMPVMSDPVGGAAHASNNPYAGLDSDGSDEEDLTRDVGVGALSFASAVRKSNAFSSLYSCASSINIGRSSHVAASSLATCPSSVVVADSGATDHMWPDYSVFTSYHPLTSKHVTLADNNKATVAGIGSIKILLDGHVIGVRNVLHVPSLRIPLYSLHAHRAMTGCGFIGNNDVFHVYFPTFVTTVNDAINSHISYTPLGPTLTRPFEYRQPRAAGSTASAYTSELHHQHAAVIPFTRSEIGSVTNDYDTNFPPLPSQANKVTPQ
jgi:hypothetical protein